MALNPTPARGEVAIAPRHGKYGMQVIGQDRDCNDIEGALAPRDPECLTQLVDILCEMSCVTIVQCDGKEKCTARNKVSTI